MSIPAYLDIARLCQELCISERTAGAWVRQDILPEPRLIGGLKRWKWAEIEERRRAKPKLGTVYFLKSGEFVKVGFTYTLRKRIRQLLTGNPNGLKIIHTMPGTPAVEAQFLRQFKHLHHRGEWFRDCPELRAFLGLHLTIERSPA